MNPQANSPQSLSEVSTLVTHPPTHPKWQQAMLILFVLVLLASTSYLAYENYQLKQIIGKPSTSPFPTSTPTVDPTADWRLYQNKFGSYEIKIPMDWKFRIGDKASAADYPEVQFDGTDQIHYIRINTFSKSSSQSVEDFIKNWGMGDTYGLSIDNLGQPFFLTGQDSNGYSIYEPSWWGSAGGILIRFIENAQRDKVIWFSLEPYNKGGTPIPNEAEYEKVFFQILSTFKFTDQNPEGKFCGGIAGVSCPNGYTCKLDGTYPDAGGTCVKN